MTSRPRIVAGGVTFILALAALAGGACGETGDTDPTPVQTFKITPAASSTVSPDGTAPAASATAETATPDVPGGAVTFTIEGLNSEFDVEALEAHPGTVTIEFDNRDSGIVHNIHFFKGDDAGGDDVAETDLEPGPVTQTLTFEVQPGEYYYQCDAHPATMNGTLTVT
jgi:plastocyanin